MPRQHGAKDLSAEKRAQIIALTDSGLTQVAICNQLGISQPLVSQTLKRYRGSETFSSGQRSG
jgi:predicted transcriptional regulator